jgi:rhodanese-related sulfurtransferase
MQHSTAFLNLVNDAKTRIQECTVDDINNMNESDTLDGLLIDTREESEFANGYIPNAIHISKGIIDSAIERTVPNKNQKMYLYCGGGFRSALVADTLQNMGYKNVISVDGGWRGWNEKKFPVKNHQDNSPKEYIKMIHNAKSQIQECTSKELYSKVQNDTLDGIIIDVREDHEVARFYIEGATHLSKGQLEVKIENLVPNKEQKLYLYCAAGVRSAMSTLSLQKMGYTNVVNISDGIQGWIKNNYPLTQD